VLTLIFAGRVVAASDVDAREAGCLKVQLLSHKRTD
jgi:hypothetical protein